MIARRAGVFADGSRYRLPWRAWLLLVAGQVLGVLAMACVRAADRRAGSCRLFGGLTLQVFRHIPGVMQPRSDAEAIDDQIALSATPHHPSGGGQ